GIPEDLCHTLPYLIGAVEPGHLHNGETGHLFPSGIETAVCQLQDQPVLRAANGLGALGDQRSADGTHLLVSKSFDGDLRHDKSSFVVPIPGFSASRGICTCIVSQLPGTAQALAALVRSPPVCYIETTNPTTAKARPAPP